ncbi:MCE family protein [Nocardioides deserti]|uniref:MCE family protein n=1 Tax=Nocardioides deserti TaxID=1588644 RepID=A0ABR6UB72_9ACTN|nr:MCE family protein [Nocardioides deserti]MBC2961383.1 MCE family protein [Nocardioides deserti]GGO72594.1 ABC transporter substrate-binding protein [Nocardioides deserti]
MTLLKRVLVPLLLVALVVVFALTVFGGSGTKTLVAQFPRAVSLYEGSDVRVLGVPIGQVEKVEPDGTKVAVTMRYDAEVKLPTDAQAVLVAPSIVGDRYVQLTPAYEGGDVLADGTILDEGRTEVPIELDDIYSSIDDLTVALGPNGANKDGALTDLLEVTAENFAGEGAKLNQTIKDFGRFSATLDNNKEELFGSLAELQGFIGTLAENDQTVRDFNDSLGSVSSLLADERQELTAALRNLSVALGQVGDFVKTNRDSLGRNITGLNRVAKVLVKQRAALDETLATAPLALNNLALTYNPQTGTLDTNANIGNLEQELVSDPSIVLCSILNQVDDSETLCNLVDSVLPRTGPFGAGTGSSSGKRFDLSLGGLVEVTR